MNRSPIAPLVAVLALCSACPSESSPSPCEGDVLPSVETCDGLDNDCDGRIDEAVARSCYDGSASTVDSVTGLPKGACRAGVQGCAAGTWEACAGQILPTSEDCGGGPGNGVDEDCDGTVDNGCGCDDGAVRPCYSGPAETAGVGACHTGAQTCWAGVWSDCGGQVVPVPEVCGNGVDEDCDGDVDDPATCSPCPDPALTCYTGPLDPVTFRPVGVCRPGTRACVDGVLGACQGQVLPSPELCDGEDNDCNGIVDDSPYLCAAGQACVNGFCVEESCGGAVQCREGYVCDAGSGCVPELCGASACPVGDLCLAGACVDPCAAVSCGLGDYCSAGVCTGGTCYAMGCAPGQICEGGFCAIDPCASVSCAYDTFCRGGACVPACALVTCPGGSRCGADGACEVDACQGVSCSPGTACEGGLCVADLCWNLSCGEGQACKAGYCVDDPCAHITCSVGTCDDGQCY
jgi:hypothetical protein